MKISHRSLSEERSRTGKGTFAPGATVGKVIRDAENMREYARYVIVLDHSGDVVDHYLNDSKGHLIDSIVVLAPAKFLGECVDYAVALEIGLSRFVPYKMTEFKTNKPGKKKQVKVIQERTRVGTLPWGITTRLLPVLWRAIQICVDKRMETWTRARFVQEYFGQRGMSVYESWITIRIPKDQPLIYTVLRLKDEQDRTSPGKTYAASAEIIHREIGLFRKLKVSYRGAYPDEVIRGSSSLRMIADWMKKNIKYRAYTNRSFEAIHKILLGYDGESLRIFKELCRVFKVPNAPRDNQLDTFESSLGEHKELLLSGCTLRPCRVIKREQKRNAETEKKGPKHALDCYTISILGSKDHMRELDERNTRNRLAFETSAKPSQVEVISECDDDIPWDPPVCVGGNLSPDTDDEPPF